MSIAEKLTTIAGNMQKIFNAGEMANQAKVDKKYFVGTAIGSGTITQTVTIPFEPDNVCIFCYADTVYNASAKSVALFQADLASVGTLGGFIFKAVNKSLSNMAFSVQRAIEACTYTNGILTIKPPQEDAVFASDSTYMIIATAEEA